MSKAEEFSELAASAIPQKWSRQKTVWDDRFILDGPTSPNDDTLLFDSAETVDFIVWCGNNRDLIADALRSVENAFDMCKPEYTGEKALAWVPCYGPSDAREVTQ